jgi:hypothetical protein
MSERSWHYRDYGITNPPVLPFAPTGAADCWSKYGSFICTRPKGHTGRHLAGGMGCEYYAVWE